MKTIAVTEYGQNALPRLAIHLTERLDPPTQSWGRYWVMRAEVVSIADDDTPRNLTSDYQPLAGFAIRAQQDAERAGRALTDPYASDPYGAEVVCGTSLLGDLSARDAERISSTHRLISRRMSALEKTFGHPRSTSAFILAAAAAMGISTFVVTLSHGSDGCYSSGAYTFITADEAASMIEHMIEKANTALREEH